MDNLAMIDDVSLAYGSSGTHGNWSLSTHDILNIPEGDVGSLTCHCVGSGTKAHHKSSRSLDRTYLSTSGALM